MPRRARWRVRPGRRAAVDDDRGRRRLRAGPRTMRFGGEFRLPCCGLPGLDTAKGHPTTSTTTSSNDNSAQTATSVDLTAWRTERLSASSSSLHVSQRASHGTACGAGSAMVTPLVWQVRCIAAVPDRTHRSLGTPERYAWCLRSALLGADIAVTVHRRAGFRSCAVRDRRCRAADSPWAKARAAVAASSIALGPAVIMTNR